MTKLCIVSYPINEHYLFLFDYMVITKHNKTTIYICSTFISGYFRSSIYSRKEETLRPHSTGNHKVGKRQRTLYIKGQGDMSSLSLSTLTALLENFWQITLHVTDGAIAKLYVK